MRGNCVDCGSAIGLVGRRTRCAPCQSDLAKVREKRRQGERLETARAARPPVHCIDCGLRLSGRQSLKRCQDCRQSHVRHRERQRHFEKHGSPKFTCNLCGLTFDGHRRREYCDACKVEHQRTKDRERSRRRRNPVTEIECIDCGNVVPGSRRRKRCEPCAVLRNADLQRQRMAIRQRRPGPRSFACERCGEVVEVGPGGKAGNSRWCDACRPAVRSEQNKARYDADPERHRKAARDYYRRDLETNRQRSRDAQARRRADPEKRLHDLRRRRSRRFGISIDEVIVVDGLVGTPCPVCSATMTDQRGLRLLCIDHDHETGRVRGVLCSSCNTALGMFNDDPTRLRAAADYLRR